MFKEKIKNVVIHLTLFWFDVQIKSQGKYNLPFLQFSQPSVHCCKIFVISGLSKFMSFLQKNGTIDWNVLPRIDVDHFSKASFNFFYVPFSLFVVSVMNFERLQKFFFVFFPSSKSTTRNTKLVCNIFIRPTIFKFL